MDSNLNFPSSSFYEFYSFIDASGKNMHDAINVMGQPLLALRLDRNNTQFMEWLGLYRRDFHVHKHSNMIYA